MFLLQFLYTASTFKSEFAHEVLWHSASKLIESVHDISIILKHLKLKIDEPLSLTLSNRRNNKLLVERVMPEEKDLIWIFFSFTSFSKLCDNRDKQK